MKWGQGKSFPIQLFVNFWELEPEAFEALLKVISSETGITEIATFVPWSVVESDAQQRFSKMLSRVAESRLNLTLIPSLELGVCAPFSGFPSDVLGPDRSAKDLQGAWLGVYAPPNMFAAPSPHQGDLEKRYQGFLARLQRDLAGWMRTMPEIAQKVRVALSAGLYGWVGDRDRSPAAALAFRRYVDDLCDRAEYRDDSRWKKTDRESLHRSGFVRLETELHRMRSARILLRGLEGVTRAQWNIVAPELDPSFDSHWAAFARGEDQGWASDLLNRIESLARKQVTVAGEVCPNFVHWLSGGPTALISEMDRQLLVLKSLVCCGGAPEGGGLMMDAQEWLRFSPRFRSRALALAQMLYKGECEDRIGIDVVTSSPAGEVFRGSLGVRVFESCEALELRVGTRLVWVEAGTIIDENSAQILIRLVQGGKTIVLSERAVVTDRAQRVLSKNLEPQPQIDLELGVRCRLYQFPQGRFLLAQYPETPAAGAVFKESVLSLCEIREPLVADGVTCVVLDRSRLAAGASALFLFNGSDAMAPVRLEMRTESRVSDLFQQDGVVKTQTLEMEVPAKGVISLAVAEVHEERKEGHHVHDAMRLEEPARSARSQSVGADLGAP